MRPKIAVSLPPRPIDSALRMVHKASRLGADLAEIRLDYLDEKDAIGEIVEGSEMPLIATFRSAKNGGARHSTEKERVGVLTNAAKVGFDYVDVEVDTGNLSSLIRDLNTTGAKTIASHHDFAKTPSDIEIRRRLQLCQDSGATVLKLVTTAKKLEDNLRLLNLIVKLGKARKLVCFAMGKIGISSRILSPVYGAALTFASLDEKTLVASGQISVSAMRRIYDQLGYT